MTAAGATGDLAEPEYRTLVLGIGNRLLSDEGVGVHVIERLARDHAERPDVQWLDGGTLSFSLAAAIEDARQLIVVDAAELKAPPGTVRVFRDHDMDRFLAAPGRRSVHEVGLVDLLCMVRLTERLPTRRALVAVQPAELGWGDGPSTLVAAALPAACREVVQLLEEWRS